MNTNHDIKIADESAEDIDPSILQICYDREVFDKLIKGGQIYSQLAELTTKFLEEAKAIVGTEVLKVTIGSSSGKMDPDTVLRPIRDYLREVTGTRENSKTLEDAVKLWLVLTGAEQQKQMKLAIRLESLRKRIHSAKHHIRNLVYLPEIDTTPLKNVLDKDIESFVEAHKDLVVPSLAVYIYKGDSAFDKIGAAGWDPKTIRDEIVF
jgi:hypothetical protein